MFLLYLNFPGPSNFMFNQSLFTNNGLLVGRLELLLQLFIRAKGAPALLGFFFNETYNTIEDYDDDNNGKKLA
jgi:hypothetical protein